MVFAEEKEGGREISVSWQACYTARHVMSLQHFICWKLSLGGELKYLEGISLLMRPMRA